MGVLRHPESGRRCHLRAEHLVGRSPHCDLCIEETYISGQHAALRWTGKAWELKDLGSRNGTSLDNAVLEPRTAYAIEEGGTVLFGRSSQRWVLEDASPPSVMAVPLGGGDPVLLEGDILVVPTGDSPEVVVLRGAQGEWQVETADGLTRIQEGELFEAGGESWRFCCPAIIAPTSALELRPSVRDARLRFSVSMDEEHVELGLECEGRHMNLGARAHNYLLLTLARLRLSDRAAGFLDSACGWVYQEDLLRDLSTTHMQLNVDICRIRKHFGTLGLREAAAVIERRAKTKQLRIGIADLIISTV